MNGQIRIAFAEDHTLIRTVIARFINEFEGCAVTIQAENGQELLDCLQGATVLPDLCILDVFMPVMNGLEALLRIRGRWPGMRVIILTAHQTEYFVYQMLHAGASALLLKSCQPSLLQEAIYSVHEHGFFSADPDHHAFLLRTMQADIGRFHLNDAEIELLQYCCSDLSYKEIAERMHTTAHSVDWHRNSLFRKLDVRSRSGLVLYAIQMGLVEMAIDETGHRFARHH